MDATLYTHSRQEWCDRWIANKRAADRDCETPNPLACTTFIDASGLFISKEGFGTWYLDSASTAAHLGQRSRDGSDAEWESVEADTEPAEAKHDEAVLSAESVMDDVPVDQGTVARFFNRGCEDVLIPSLAQSPAQACRPISIETPTVWLRRRNRRRARRTKRRRKVTRSPWISSSNWVCFETLKICKYYTGFVLQVFFWSLLRAPLIHRVGAD